MTVRVNTAAKSGTQRRSILREEATGFIPDPTSVTECFGPVWTGPPLWGPLNKTMAAPPRNLTGRTDGLKNRRRRRRLFPLLLRWLAGDVQIVHVLAGVGEDEPRCGGGNAGGRRQGRRRRRLVERRTGGFRLTRLSRPFRPRSHRERRRQTRNYSSGEFLFRFGAVQRHGGAGIFRARIIDELRNPFKVR